MGTEGRLLTKGSRRRLTLVQTGQRSWSYFLPRLQPNPAVLPSFVGVRSCGMSDPSSLSSPEGGRKDSQHKGKKRVTLSLPYYRSLPQYLPLGSATLPLDTRTPRPLSLLTVILR